MASGERPSIQELLNGTAPASTTPTPPSGTAPAGTAVPAPSPGPAPAPQPQPPSPPPPAPWPVPVPPARGGSGSITYTEQALHHFANTSDDRAAAFQQADAQAGQIRLAPDAFGYMFGAMVHSAYAQHAQSISDGLQSAATAMSGIADAIRLSAERIQAADANIISGANQVNG